VIVMVALDPMIRCCSRRRQRGWYEENQGASPALVPAPRWRATSNSTLPSATVEPAPTLTFGTSETSVETRDCYWRRACIGQRYVERISCRTRQCRFRWHGYHMLACAGIDPSRKAAPIPASRQSQRAYSFHKMSLNSLIGPAPSCVAPLGPDRVRQYDSQIICGYRHGRRNSLHHEYAGGRHEAGDFGASPV
jgi:hypothetical protein